MHATENEVNASTDPHPVDEEEDMGLDTLGAGIYNQTQSSLKRGAALFLLKTKEKGRVSQAALNEIVADLTGLIQVRLDEVQREVKSIIQQGSAGDTISAVEHAFNKSEISRPFAGLESAYQQQKYFTEELHMLVCQPIILWP